MNKLLTFDKILIRCSIIILLSLIMMLCSCSIQQKVRPKYTKDNVSFILNVCKIVGENPISIEKIGKDIIVDFQSCEYILDNNGTVKEYSFIQEGKWITYSLEND